MQTILGSGGIIGQEASYCLSEFSDQIRQVSRKPRQINATDQIFPADLRNESEVRTAVKGSEIVYLTAGLPYNTKIWAESWPKIMSNTIKACQEHHSKLVFFDNVYMYGKVDGFMTEDTPFNPCSTKGEIRAIIARQLMEEMEKGNIQALIARSADFYGPKASNTYITPMLFEKLKTGSKPQFMLTANKKHSFTYTPDAAKAMAFLGNKEEAYGQVWHLPTDQNALSMKEWSDLTSKYFGSRPDYSILSPWMIKMASLFSPVVRESQEMLYQFKYDYLFDSSKFTNKYFGATSYAEGIKTIYNMQYK
ncbi:MULTISPECIES: NAD-dependent epimerase/dehydratase family protein [unclassified Lentimicrobium]|uniref:NAD-dependent epimerase/dehydratase family protein n=1 Tax=unclassified Lentimicrobium TaxID=2677434 RepID=UPI001552A969|nr:MULTISPECIES: NAD-dependent epimerase/dehydratase family protein [unclassified Lentimicrobium]NPD47204.1 NAD-dependent epimerase/dehydratase family protein [Lentimicrobium sp. S6]NPD84873.1 NAD-dependent epimerase/dehydratase family protein [Lentimicrobium sp. L6]